MELDKIIASLNESFKKELTEERLSEKINCKCPLKKILLPELCPAA